MPESNPSNPSEDEDPVPREPAGFEPTNEIPSDLRAMYSSRRPVMPGEDSVSSSSQTEMQRLDRRVDESRNDVGTPIAANYKLLDHIGQGTFGTVWEAINLVTEEHVAIKFFLRGGVLESVIDETRMLGKLAGCTGIMGYKEVCWTAEDPYYVMSLATGGSLADLLGEARPDVRETVRLFEQIVEAMAFVHAKGVIHCDLKPGNILLSEDGHPLIADFGQSHLATNISPALGTFFYMAPEQASLEATVPDTRWDVYALGAILHEMLTGAPPRSTPSFREGLAALRNAHTKERLKFYRTQAPLHPVADLRQANRIIDAPLANVVRACLEIDPARRPRDAGDVLDLLRRRRRTLKNRPFIRGAIEATCVGLLGIALLSYFAADRIIRDAREELRGEIHASLTYTAHLGGQLLEEKLRDRMEFLSQSAVKIQLNPEQIERLREARRKYRQALKTGADVSDYKKIVSEAERRKIGEMLTPLDADYRRNNSQTVEPSAPGEAGSRGDGSVYLFTLNADDHAFHLALSDESGAIVTDLNTFAQNWAWRDYFNGTGDKEDRKNEAFPPSNRPHFTEMYLSKRLNEWVIDLSVPVLDLSVAEGHPDRVLGKLITSMKRDRDLTKWLSGKNILNADAQLARAMEFAVLIRRDDQLQWNAVDGDSKPLRADHPERALVGLVLENRTPTAMEYIDPSPSADLEDAGASKCLAAWEPFQPDAKPAANRGWYFMVKRPLGGVGGKSFQELQRKLKILGLILFAVILGAAVMAWYWLLRLLNEGDSLMVGAESAGTARLLTPSGSALTPRRHRGNGSGSASPKSPPGGGR